MITDRILLHSAWLSIAAMLLLSLQAGASEPFDSITEKQIEEITYEDAMEDMGFVTPLAPNLEHLQDDRRKNFDELVEKLDKWDAGNDASLAQKVRNWLCLATLGDLSHGEFEGEVPYAIFERLKKDVPKAQLIKAAAWIVLKPDEGKALISAPDLGAEGESNEGLVRERSALYAKKLLGRLLGKLPPKEDTK